MKQTLILLRHGNTFEPDVTPVWVGARTDLPLAKKGVEQADAASQAFLEAELTFSSLIAGPLERTRKTAEHIALKLSIPSKQVMTDIRLREIDYGLWEARSTEEIRAMGSEEELAQWDLHSVFPVRAGWSPSEQQITSDVSALLADIVGSVSLFVTSNGIMRYFARLASNADEFPHRKVATGHLCVLEKSSGTQWRIKAWNIAPSKLAEQIDP